MALLEAIEIIAAEARLRGRGGSGVRREAGSRGAGGIVEMFCWVFFSPVSFFGLSTNAAELSSIEAIF